jgi:pimeloyl-ACP methyl ester carboxylesterase
MRKRMTSVGVATALLAVVPCAGHAAPAAALSFAPCSNAQGFSCATAPVPVDRSGGTPGTIGLSVALHLAGSTPSQVAVIALAGGPGQAALPLAPFVLRALAPALATRDLVLFDQRGTGSSDPLSCPALQRFPSSGVALQLEQCALEIGPARRAFTSPESVEDIETLRQLMGYSRLVLYGTSYGTKVALEYAARYPTHVQSLVLDSVVPVDAPEPLALPSYGALPKVLSELCEARSCAHITPNPLGDLARLIARLRKHALRGYAYDGGGRRRRASLDESGVLEILQAGDLNPALRALFPAAVRSALRHDPVPLLRLHLLSEGLVPNLPRGSAEAVSEVDEALFVTTSCEELPFPWQRGASASARTSEALGAVHALPAAAFFPFDASTAYANSLIPACVSWPDASPAPPAPAQLPGIPALILSGAQDLRTPTSSALAVAALIPQSQVLVVPFTGHSVLGSDFSECADAAVASFFAGTVVQPCPATPRLFTPTPIAPTKLGAVRPPVGFSGRSGRTLTAVLDAILDLERQVITATLQADAELPAGSSFGGLRGGFARLTSSAVLLRSFSFIPGVALSGRLPIGRGELQPGTLRVSGRKAARGTIRLESGRRVVGTLAGTHFDISLAGVHLASAHLVGGWPARALHFPLPALVERAARR